MIGIRRVVLDRAAVDSEEVSRGRALLLRIRIQGGGQLLLLSAHLDHALSASGRDSSLWRLQTSERSYPSAVALMGGDWNFISAGEGRATDSAVGDGRARERTGSLFGQLLPEMSEAFRIMHTFCREVVEWTPQVFSRLDRWYTNMDEYQVCERCP